MLSEQLLQNDILTLIKNMGDMGVFLGMLLESSIVPIPSEVIIIGAGAIGIPIASIVLFGSLGATIGAAIGYTLGKYLAMPVLVRFGKYVFIKPEHIQKAINFAKKYGILSVLIGRVLPIIPFKVFSIAAGITKMPFVPFIICTLIGVVPRILILSIFGYGLVKYKRLGLLALAIFLLIFLIYKRVQNKRAAKNSLTEKEARL